MRTTKSVTRTIAGVSCALALMAGTAAAQTHDKRVFYTFSGQVEIPGAVLPAGQYMFHLADPDSGRKVIQVQSADGKKVYSMFFSVPVNRPEPSDEAEVRFMEAAAGAAPAIKTMWYAGERTGREFIYPKDQATRIAKATNQSVLTTQAKTTKADEAESGDLTRVSPSGQDTNIAQDAAPAAPTGRSMRGSDDATDAPAAVARNDNSRSVAAVGTSGRTPVRESLPRTAGSTPLSVLLGLGLLAGGAAVRAWRTVRA